MDTTSFKDYKQRLKEYSLKHGIDGLSSREILELILFYTTNRETKEIADRLLYRFGSVSNVLDAPVSALKDIDGVTENAAVLFKLIPQILRSYEVPEKGYLLDSTEAVKKYFKRKYIGEFVEKFMICCLDEKFYTISCNTVNTGTATSVDAKPEMIVSEAVNTKCKYVILSHNHPHQINLPSDADKDATSRYIRELLYADIVIIDHIVVGENGVFSMKENGTMDFPTDASEETKIVFGAHHGFNPRRRYEY